MDSTGNSDNCSFEVTPIDDVVPVISGCPSDIVLTNSASNCAPIATWVSPFAEDNCELISFTKSHISGLEFPPGVTFVTYTAIDNTGNSDTCFFDVIVNNTVVDTTSPEILNCPLNINSCSPVTAYVPPTISDNCNLINVARELITTTTFTTSEQHITYTATDDSGNSTECSFTITQYPLPVANAGSDLAITVGNQTTIGGNPTGSGGTPSLNSNGYTFLWYPGAGLSDVNVSNPPASPQQTTEYTLFVVDSIGCAATDQMTLTVNPSLNAPASEKGVAVSKAPHSFNRMNLQVYPNPATDIVQLALTDVSMNGDIRIYIEILNLLGKRVFLFKGESVSQAIHSIDVSHWVQGQYLVKVTKGEMVETEKLVVF
jgi:hypothetical protein